MRTKDRELNNWFQEAFLIHDEIAKFETIQEILNLVDAGEMEIDSGINELISGIRQEKSLLVLSYVWAKLAKMKPRDELKAFAESELNSEDVSHRRYALKYLAEMYPEERQMLFDRMSDDPSPAVLLEAGKAIVALNMTSAVNIWFRAFGRAPHVMAEEMLPLLIGQYADEDFLDEVKELSQDNPDHFGLQNILWVSERWRMVDYLDVSEPVGIGDGYWTRCPNCGVDIAIRNNHTGERGRCRNCQNEFIIPEKPEIQ